MALNRRNFVDESDSFSDRAGSPLPLKRKYSTELAADPYSKYDIHSVSDMKRLTIAQPSPAQPSPILPLITM